MSVSYRVRCSLPRECVGVGVGQGNQIEKVWRPLLAPVALAWHPTWAPLSVTLVSGLPSGSPHFLLFHKASFRAVQPAENRPSWLLFPAAWLLFFLSQHSFSFIHNPPCCTSVCQAQCEALDK